MRLGKNGSFRERQGFREQRCIRRGRNQCRASRFAVAGREKRHRTQMVRGDIGMEKLVQRGRDAEQSGGDEGESEQRAKAASA